MQNKLSGLLLHHKSGKSTRRIVFQSIVHDRGILIFRILNLSLSFATKDHYHLIITIQETYKTRQSNKLEVERVSKEDRERF